MEKGTVIARRPVKSNLSRKIPEIPIGNAKSRKPYDKVTEAPYQLDERVPQRIEVGNP